MKAELEFFVGGVTTDMVEDVCRQIFDDLTDPHSPLHTELSGLGLDGGRYDDLKIEEHNHNLGTTIAIEFLDRMTDGIVGALAGKALDVFWTVLKRRLKARYDRSPGKRIK